MLVSDKLLHSINRTIFNEGKKVRTGEISTVELNAKKVSITSRGSLREYAIDVIHCSFIEQATMIHLNSILIYQMTLEKIL